MNLPRKQVVTGLALAVCIMGLEAFVVGTNAGCASVPAAITAVEVAAPYIDGALCSAAATQAVEPGWETFLCNVLDPGGKPVSFYVKVPATEAKAFAMAHQSRGSAVARP
jgi:hypothetical protein